MTTSVLITNHNSWVLARRCVDVCNSVEPACIHEIIVVDDCSKDGPPADWPESVKLFRNSTNIGFGASLNRGFECSQSDVVLVVDADAYPLTPFVVPITRMFDSDPNLAVVGFTTFDGAGRRTPSADLVPRVLSLTLGQRIDSILERRFPSRDRRAFVYTCSMAVRRSVFEQLGGFDPELRWLDVDVDFCMRVIRSGGEVLVSDEARFYHEGGGTPVSSSARVAEFYRSRWYLVQKHGLAKHPRRALALLRARIRFELCLCICLSWLPGRSNYRSAQAAARREVLRSLGIERIA